MIVVDSSVWFDFSMDQHARGGATRWPARRTAPRHHGGETKASGVVVRSPMPVLSLAVRQPPTATGPPPRGSKPPAAGPARNIGIAIQPAEPDSGTPGLVLSAQIRDVSMVGLSGLLLSSSFTNDSSPAAANPAPSSPLTSGRPSF